jgi:hypothetical protein
MTGETEGGAQRACCLRPRCLGAVGPRIRESNLHLLRNIKQVGVAKVSVNSKDGYGKRCFCAWFGLYASADVLFTIVIMCIRFTKCFVHTAELCLITLVGRKITGMLVSRGFAALKRSCPIFDSTAD